MGPPAPPGTTPLTLFSFPCLEIWRTQNSSIVNEFETLLKKVNERGRLKEPMYSTGFAKNSAKVQLISGLVPMLAWLIRDHNEYTWSNVQYSLCIFRTVSCVQSHVITSIAGVLTNTSIYRPMAKVHITRYIQ